MAISIVDWVRMSAPVACPHVYVDGRVFKSVVVEERLQAPSTIPTRNVFELGMPTVKLLPQFAVSRKN